MSDVPRMLRDILDQPESLKQVLDHQFGRGAHVLEQAADTIRSVPTIIVTGMGASLYGAMPLAYQLNSIGRACQVVEAGELLHFGGDLPRGALVIIVSRSGETVEAVNLLPKLTAARAHVIAVTNDRTSRLAREADLALCVNSRADEAVAIQSYTGTAMLSLLLAAEVMGREVREQADAAVETCKTTLEGNRIRIGTSSSRGRRSCTCSDADRRSRPCTKEPCCSTRQRSSRPWQWRLVNSVTVRLRWSTRISAPCCSAQNLRRSTWMALSARGSSVWAAG